MSNNPFFMPNMSSDEIYLGQDVTVSLTDEVNSKVDINHTHSGYVSSEDLTTLSDDLTTLEDVINTKANATHTHSEYASSAHTHDIYITQVTLDTLEETLGKDIDEKASISHTHIQDDVKGLSTALDGKANVSHSHSGYAPSSHTHSDYVATTTFATLETEVEGKANISHVHSNYAETTHNHNTDYADISHNHDNSYALVGHDHNEDYATISHSHSDYATVDSVNELSTTVTGKANVSHSHDNTYYTESEIDTKLANKSDSNHNHAGVYDTVGSAASALNSANVYTDTKIDALVGEGASTTLDTIGEISSAIEDNQEAVDLLNAAIANKANISHSHAIIDVTNLQDTLNNKASVTHTHTASDVGAAASSHSHNDTYYTETEVDTLLSGKANSSHTHTIANITNLQTQLDGKASTSHGAHVSFSTTAPVMDGSASVGTATTVARSDHKHPVDTSRASQTDLDALETVVAGKANSSHTHTIANVTNLQSTLDGKASSGHTHGAATTSASGFMTKDMVTKLNGIAAGANAYTLPTASSTLGGVKTTSTVTSANGYTACPIISGVPYYKDTNTTYNLGSFGITATATELNYVDGVTSNVQTQLNGKASSSHSHTASAVGAVATGDVATVSEVETYLGI